MLKAGQDWRAKFGRTDLRFGGTLPAGETRTSTPGSSFARRSQAQRLASWRGWCSTQSACSRPRWRAAKLATARPDGARGGRWRGRQAAAIELLHCQEAAVLPAGCGGAKGWGQEQAIQVRGGAMASCAGSPGAQAGHTTSRPRASQCVAARPQDRACWRRAERAGCFAAGERPAAGRAPRCHPGCLTERCALLAAACLPE